MTRTSRTASRLPAALAAGAVVLLHVPVRAAAQQTATAEPVPITLEAAVSTALEANPSHRIAGARTAIARAEARAGTSPLLPAVDVGAGYARSADPVFAFGTKLRQERFGQADFAVDALNRPDPINDWTMDVGVRWNLLDPTAWAGRSAAGSRAEAAGWEEAWSRDRTTFATRALYFAAVGADAALEVAEAEEAAARATRDLFRRRREAGLLTDADVLSAEAELRSAEARRLGARRDRDRAREDLALQLGWDVDRVPVPVDTLGAPPPSAGAPAALPAGSSVAPRADLRALAAASDAAGADATRAGVSFLPRVEGFAGWQSHADRAFGVDGSDWTVGVALRWTVFSGLGRFAARRRAVEAREIARIRQADALRTARAEVVQARRDVSASWSGLEATRAAASAADEARQLMTRRFEEGLATPADLLQAEARAAEARGREVQALVTYNVALARLDLVAPEGADPVSEEMP
ncbi:MAG: TolC family protein [Gemmatimonadales bacterium]